jgi:hypothetical protein
LNFPAVSVCPKAESEKQKKRTVKRAEIDFLLIFIIGLSGRKISV